LGCPSARDAALSLHRQLKAAILDGRLPTGLRLLPSRRAGTVFGVSRNTSIAVYDRLLNKGYVVSLHGSGTRVAEMLPAAAPALCGGGNAEAIVQALAQRDVTIRSLDRYAFERPALPGLIFGYGAGDEAVLGLACDFLSEILSR
jgi:DNA-binding FadR family transcriptional regulator